MDNEKRERLAEIKRAATVSSDMWPDDWGWLIFELEEAWRELEVAKADKLLVQFVGWLMREWCDEPGDFDAMDIQEAAIKYGLLIPTEVHEPCSENCFCVEYHGEFPTICNKLSPALREAIDAAKGDQ